MTLRFGTDGVRGPADELTDAFVVALGEAAGRVLGVVGDSRFVIGRDTRESGERIERALATGVQRAGLTPTTMAVVPTPAVAWVCAQRSIPGAVISASHNPWSDNGIKFFSAGGQKLSEEVEEQLEALIDELLGSGSDLNASPVVVETDVVAIDGWCDAVVASASRPVSSMRVVIDCANGASSNVASRILRELGVDVDVLHATPNGRNINEGCGSTHPEELQRRVLETGAQLGLAFDGDADRLLAVDENGQLLDGDQLIALFAADLHGRGALAANQVVVTVMTNLGFRIAMAKLGIEVIDTAVGDRYVLEALERTGASLGGEQSGHIIFSDLASTGDGVLSGVQLLALMAQSGRPLSEMASQSMTRLPQVLLNVKVANRRSDIAQVIASDIAAVEAELGASGRVLIRPSGTEPLVRVMVEALSAEQAQECAHRLVAAVQQACAA